MHYNKAVRFFTLVDSSVEILRAQLERVALAEFQLNSQTSVSSKQKTLHVALDHLIESTTALNNLEEQLSCKEETVDVSTMDAIENEARDLLGILESRLQFVLLNLVKVTSPVAKKGKTSSEPSHQQQCYKNMYAEALKVTQRSSSKVTDSDDPKNTSVLDTCKKLIALLKTLETLKKEMQGS